MKILLLKLIAATCLLLAGMVGLGMSLCGAFGTFVALHDQFALGLLLGVPSVWAGLVLMRFVYKVNWGLERLFVSKDQLGEGTCLLVLGIIGLGVALYGAVATIGFNLLFRKDYELFILYMLLFAAGVGLMRFVYKRVKHAYTWPYKLPCTWPYEKSLPDDKVK